MSRARSRALRAVAALWLCAVLGAPHAQAADETFQLSIGAGLRVAPPGATEGFRLTTLAAADATTGAVASSSNDEKWRTVPPSQPDWRGAKRDVTHFLSYQIVGVAVLYVMPESVTHWSSEDKRNFGFEQWWENVTHPQWDSDTFVVNYVLHPYWGGAYYTRARERGLDRMQSFWFSALMSTLWEFGAEAIAEQPSIQDLIFTPVLGSLLGEYVFAPLRQSIKSKSGPLDWADKTLLVLTDPLGAINEKVDQWFGLQASIQVAPNAWRRSPGALAAAGGGDPRHRPADGWSLQMRASW